MGQEQRVGQGRSGRSCPGNCPSRSAEVDGPKAGPVGPLPQKEADSCIPEGPTDTWTPTWDPHGDQVALQSPGVRPGHSAHLLCSALLLRPTPANLVLGPWARGLVGATALGGGDHRRSVCRTTPGKQPGGQVGTMPGAGVSCKLAVVSMTHSLQPPLVGHSH